MKNVIEEDLIKESIYIRKRALKFTKDDVEAEDLLQDVFIESSKQHDCYGEQGSTQELALYYNEKHLY